MSYNALLRSNNMIRNHEGAKAWMQTPEFELYSTVVCTMSIDDKFYESSSDRINRIASLVRMVSAEFVAQLAIYARTDMHLRSIPMLLLVELSQCHSGDSLVSHATAQTIQRVDDITELLACYQWRRRTDNLKRLSHQLRKGLAKAFNKFDEYQFAKYNRNGKKVTLRDALFLVHPKAKDEAQQLIFDKIAHDKLEIPYTWETQISQIGQKKGLSWAERLKLRQNTWKELIESRRMGYMAILRNLRNMLSCHLDEATMLQVFDYLSDESAVRKSKQLPFRFFSAFLKLNEYAGATWNTFDCSFSRRIELQSKRKELMGRYSYVRMRKVCKKRFDFKQSTMLAAVKKAGIESYGSMRPWHVARVRCLRMKHTRLSNHLKKYLVRLDVETQSFVVPPALNNCLETAVKHSTSNIPAFDDDTRVCIACDTSGSMMSPISNNSVIEGYDLALFFGAIMKYRCPNAIIGMFGDTWLPVDMPKNAIMRNVMKMRNLEGRVGYSTNGHKVIEWLIENSKAMDKVIIFTDCQLWNSESNDASLGGAWKTYKETIAPNARLYLFDLDGYGTNPIDVDAEKDVYCIAGWSDKVFDMLAAIENGKSVIDEIRRIVV